MNKGTMTTEQISAAEIKIIRWGEKVLTPVLVAGFIGVVSFLIHVGNSMAQLETEQRKYNDNDQRVQQELVSVNVKLDDAVKAQQSIEITIQRIDTTQQNLKENIQELKLQNTKIIELLSK